MKKRWIAAPLILLIAVGGSGYAWWQSPASTSVDHGAQDVGNVLASATALKAWQTSYFSTRIPSTLRIKTSNDSAHYGSYLLTSLSARDSDQVGVTVASLGGDSLNEIPAVRLRLNQPAQYAVSSRSFAPSGAYVFTNSDGYETSVFWQQGGQYAAVVVSGTAARRAELEQTLQAIVSNWSWQ